MSTFGKSCPKCGSNDIDTDGARGEAVCTNCGHVLEECVIVSEVQFSESAGGQSSVVGQFVPESGLSSFRSGPGYSGFTKDSREVTLSNGRRVIQHMAGLLRLVAHHVDVAQRFFQQAVQRNFIQGRKTHTVVAVCLYIVCRKQKTSHMLIDFAEVLQMDVYELGSVFLKFTKLLHIKLDPIDPSLYIHRFASMLEFGDKTQIVSLTALRIVARMNRDWMITGRRPAGICGAGLLIASKMHNFKRTEGQIAQVVRICDGTLRKRLVEFDDTNVSNLTVEEFHEIFKGGTQHDAAAGFKAASDQWGWDDACAPPALKNNLREEKQAVLKKKRKAAGENARGDGEGDGEGPEVEKGSSSREKFEDLRESVREAVMALGGGVLQELDVDSADPNASVKLTAEQQQKTKSQKRAQKKSEKKEAERLAAIEKEKELSQKATQDAAGGDVDGADAEGGVVIGEIPNGDEQTDEDLEDLDDDEIESYIRTEEEVTTREVRCNPSDLPRSRAFFLPAPPVSCRRPRHLLSRFKFLEGYGGMSGHNQLNDESWQMTVPELGAWLGVCGAGEGTGGGGGCEGCFVSR